VLRTSPLNMKGCGLAEGWRLAGKVGSFEGGGRRGGARPRGTFLARAAAAAAAAAAVVAGVVARTAAADADANGGGGGGGVAVPLAFTASEGLVVVV